MSQESKGFVMKIWSKPEYGMMAHQQAMSLKYHSPSIPIHLFTDEAAVSRLRDMRFFDTVQYTNTPSDAAQAKIDLYDQLPFDHNIFLDADGICVSEMDSVFDQLISHEKPFRCFVYAHYNQHDPIDMPLMVWARRDVIWEHYELNGETLPATQSSMLYIRKGDLSKEIYSRMQLNYANRIPLENLKNKWGGGQPDELYLNVTLAQMNYDPSFHNIIYFADDRSLMPHQIKHQYKLLCLFGTAANVKPVFERFYNSEVQSLARQMGISVTYQWKNLKMAKHANTRQIMHKRKAFQGGFIRSERITPNVVIDKKGSTYLFTSFFESGELGRQRELRHCLEQNLNNVDIDHVFVSSESPSLPEHPKLTVRIADRPTYQDMIDWANEIVNENDVVVIANSDIYFDSTIRWPHASVMNRTMIALSRWNVHPSGAKKLFAYEHSQDTWIFKGKIHIKNADFYFGKPGCDNRIAYEADQQGYRVVNTAKDIITYHLHNTNVRHYSESDRLQGNYYPVFITSIRNLKTNKLLIQQPGKVGDILICLPIAKYYADRGYAVEWECPREFHSMFDYVDYVKPVTAKGGEYARIIDISFGINTQSPSHVQWLRRKKQGIDSFVRLKYELSEVPIENRYNLSYTRNTIREQELFDHLELSDDTPYILFHGQSDYGDPVPVPETAYRVVFFEKIQDFTVFDWRKVIENAMEIHCIDSCLANLVEVIETDAKKVFYRVKQRTTESLFDFNNKWKLICT